MRGGSLITVTIMVAKEMSGGTVAEWLAPSVPRKGEFIWIGQDYYKVTTVQWSCTDTGVEADVWVVDSDPGADE